MIATTTTLDSCGKCDGTGVIQAFRHIDNGVCYACNGVGQVTTKVSNTVAFNPIFNSHDIEDRRIRFFGSLTVDKFLSLPRAKRDFIADWSGWQYETNPAICDRFMTVFRAAWLASV
jgi:hypothetical protein